MQGEAEPRPLWLASHGLAFSFSHECIYNFMHVHSQIDSSLTRGSGLIIECLFKLWKMQIPSCWCDSHCKRNCCWNLDLWSRGALIKWQSTFWAVEIFRNIVFVLQSWLQTGLRQSFPHKKSYECSKIKSKLQHAMWFKIICVAIT